MGLSLEDFTVRKPGLPCGVARVRDALDKADRAVLDEALSRPWEKQAAGAISHAAIERVLADNGHGLKQLQIARHRRQLCGCFK